MSNKLLMALGLYGMAAGLSYYNAWRWDAIGVSFGLATFLLGFFHATDPVA